MRKSMLLLLCISMLMISSVYAQRKELTGKVTDATGSPIPGASVKVKGAKTGTSADANGVFKINVTENATLSISGIGFETQEINVKNLESIKVSLRQSNTALSEVVVTALGIPRQKKALGYSVTTIDKKDLELRPEGDVGRILNGKVAGLDVLNSSGISGSGTNIVIRGVSSITGGASSPLFIVDGVPFDASNNSLNGDFQYGDGTSSSSRFLDLDPNNIESVNVLKGLSAATLYGEAGRNGVILITTKNGASHKTNKKFEITASQSIFATTISNLPDYQNHYGGGFDLVPSAAFSNWGAKFTNPPAQIGYSPYLVAAYPQYKGKTQDYKAYTDNVKDFFRTGIFSSTSINLASSGANTTFNANYSYTDDEGFTPNNRVYKNNFGLGGTAKLTNNFTINTVLNFAVTDFQTPVVGANGGGGGPDVTSVF
ncbi:MAG TPA: TonB-dependent receptor plug domain-containing protein, partial [Puia sp.]|nr:TonB-dependent receptor plug domain-containing protein [Puia sp.]